MRKILLPVLAVSAVFVEWIEFSVYLYLSTIISGFFFPKEDPQAAFLLTLGIFCASYLIRPIGGSIYGYIADRTGRKRVMIISVFLMSVATFAIGLLPTYEQIGILAPILLLLCRLTQGFAIAIEFNNASVYLIEHMKKHKILASSFVSSASAGGMCVGALIVSNLDFVANPESWRIPFLALGIVSFMILGLRHLLTESPEYEELKKQDKLSKNPFLELFKNYKFEVLVIAAIGSFIGAFLYGGHLYLINFLVKHRGFSLELASDLSFKSQLLLAILSPIFAYFGEKLKVSFKLFVVGIFGLSLISPVIFLIADGGIRNLELLRSALYVYAIVNAMFASYLFYFLNQLLPTRVRCTGLGLSYSFAVAIVGGTAPISSEYMVNHHFIIGPGLYATFMGMFLMTCLKLYIDKSKLVKEQEEVAVRS